MDSKDINLLQEAYLEVYSDLDESEKWIQKAIKHPGALRKQLGVGVGEKIPAKKLSSAAKKGGTLGKRARLAQTLKSLNKEEMDIYDIVLSHLLDEGYADTPESAEVIMLNMSEDWRDSIIDEATAMAKRGYDEAPIRQKIAASTGGGAAADRAKTLADKPTYGQRGVNLQARQQLARKQMGDFRKTTSSNPGLHGYAHKPANAQQQALQSARGAQRGALTPAEKRQLGR